MANTIHYTQIRLTSNSAYLANENRRKLYKGGDLTTRSSQ